MLIDIPLALFAAAAAVAFFAGIVKGVTGFAMPMLMISGIGSFLPAETALAGLILPTLVTNVWQAVRQGPRAAITSARAHRRFLIVGFVCLVIAAQFVTRIPAATLFLVLGVPVVAFAALQLVGWRPQIGPSNKRPAELGFGILAGSIGGLSGVWGPPTVLYLTALNTPKIEHVRVQGVVYSSGAVVLALAHFGSGILDREGMIFSGMLILPAIAGLVLGFSVQDRLDQDKFRWAILITLAVAGLNLIRRGLFM